MPTVPSPCTKDCKIDPATGLCRGCLRTIEEIVRWGGADAAEKKRTLAAIADRRSRREQEACAGECVDNDGGGVG